MKRIVLTLSAMLVILACGSTYAQNIEYDGLKDLEPLVGTYRREWTNQETEKKSESILQVSWSESKKMLVVELQSTTASPGQLKPAGRQHFFWNSIAKRIECVGVWPNSGVVTIAQVKSLEDGVFVLEKIRLTTTNRAWQTDVKIKSEKNSITYFLSNRADTAGNVMDDVEWVWERVAPIKNKDE